MDRSSTHSRFVLGGLLGLALGGLLACSDAPPAPSDAATAPPVSNAAPTPGAPDSETRLALWVLCEGSQRALSSPERIEAMLEIADQLGATDLFVQVYRGGRAWFDSTRADRAPFLELLAGNGADPLPGLIEAAHQRGMRVHAWVNVLSLAGRRTAAILDALGPEAVLVDRRGRSILSYPNLEIPPPERALVRMGTPAVWLDPAAPGVAEWLAATFAELAGRYPALDGLHMDYVRYPDVLPFSPGARFGVGIDFGYGDASRARFEAETGRSAPIGDRLGNADAWDDWRRDQVTRVVEQIRAATQAVHPGLLLSAAVSAYPERAYLSLFQDWRGWLDRGLLDFAVTMLYSRDDRLLRYEARAYVGGVGGERVWIGLGTWLFATTPERAVAQLDTVRAVDPAGISFFSYDSLADSPPLLDALRVAVAR